MNGFLIGITGPTGAGKSYVSEIFAKKGFAVIDADEIAREIMQPGSKYLQDAAKHFGNDIINPDGSLNRALLASRAFVSKEKTELLNSISHPAIIERTLQIAKEMYNNGHELILFDAALLFESGSNKICRKTIAVCAPENIRLSRIIERDNLTIEQAKLRMSAQKSNDYYINQCDYVIMNNGTMDELINKAENIADRLIKEYECLKIHP